MSTSRNLERAPFWREKKLVLSERWSTNHLVRKYRLKQYSETCIKQNLAEVTGESHDQNRY